MIENKQQRPMLIASFSGVLSGGVHPPIRKLAFPALRGLAETPCDPESASRPIALSATKTIFDGGRRRAATDRTFVNATPEKRTARKSLSQRSGQNGCIQYFVPEDLITFWLGHAGKSVTGASSDLSGDAEFRKQVAERVCLGFELASEPAAVAPNTSKIEVGPVAALAVNF
jgi:hypothetical protein